jgi:hypothetical protein
MCLLFQNRLSARLVYGRDNDIRGTGYEVRDTRYGIRGASLRTERAISGIMRYDSKEIPATASQEVLSSFIPNIYYVCDDQDI